MRSPQRDVPSVCGGGGAVGQTFVGLGGQEPRGKGVPVRIQALLALCAAGLGARPPHLREESSVPQTDQPPLFFRRGLHPIHQTPREVRRAAAELPAGEERGWMGERIHFVFVLGLKGRKGGRVPHVTQLTKWNCDFSCYFICLDMLVGG